MKKEVFDVFLTTLTVTVIRHFASGVFKNSASSCVRTPNCIMNSFAAFAVLLTIATASLVNLEHKIKGLNVVGKLYIRNILYLQWIVLTLIGFFNQIIWCAHFFSYVLSTSTKPPSWRWKRTDLRRNCYLDPVWIVCDLLFELYKRKVM